MNQKNHFIPIDFLGNMLKTFVSKLTQHPDYYNIKCDYKNKRRYRHNNKQW